MSALPRQGLAAERQHKFHHEHSARQLTANWQTQLVLFLSTCQRTATVRRPRDSCG